MASHPSSDATKDAHRSGDLSAVALCAEAEAAKVGDAPLQATPVVIRSRRSRRSGVFRRIDIGSALAGHAGMPKRFVYILKNRQDPPRYYTGVTSNVSVRHAEHNAGRCAPTSRHRPWTIDVVIEFADEQRAVAFERYLKSGSGVAFSRRHLR
jgi:predicted GIY-YIG superfamily endonuclease